VAFEYPQECGAWAGRDVFFICWDGGAVIADSGSCVLTTIWPWQTNDN